MVSKQLKKTNNGDKTMSTRFTETSKWQDPWYRKLSPNAKTLFTYFTEMCNLAGFTEIDEEDVLFRTKIPPDQIKNTYKELEKSVCVKGGWAWSKNFLKHQKNLPLNPENNAHKHIIYLISEQVDRFTLKALEDKLGAVEGLISSICNIKCSKGKVKSKGRFTPPTLEEITAYCKERKNLVNPSKFLNHYESNGWKVGKNKMVDWRASVRTWEQNGEKPPPKQGVLDADRTRRYLKDMEAKK